MADPEQVPSWVSSFLGLLGLAGGTGAVAKTVLNASAVDSRLNSLESDRESHASRLDATERTLGVLVDRSDRAEKASEQARKDREQILVSLSRIEGRLP